MICCKSDSESARIAADYLMRGEVVVLPTDTVYGFSGLVDDERRAFHTDAKIRNLKRRDDGKPFIQLIEKPTDLARYTRDVVPDAVLARWPGALTVVVRTPRADDAYATTAFRCPGDEWLRRVISLCGAPLYSTSVNRSGSPVLDNVQAIADEFGSEIPLIVDDGDRRSNIPSTIVSLAVDGSITLVRQGAVTL